MLYLTQDARANLTKLNQRVLADGELFLLAKAIADKLPLMPQDQTNVTLYILTYKESIEQIIYAINDYSYLSQESKDVIYKLIGELTLWRSQVAYAGFKPLFKLDISTVTDDLCGLSKYIDPLYIGSVNDVLNNANYMYGLFYEIASGYVEARTK